jgi:hypothetical protein
MWEDCCDSEMGDGMCVLVGEERWIWVQRAGVLTYSLLLMDHSGWAFHHSLGVPYCRDYYSSLPCRPSQKHVSVLLLVFFVEATMEFEQMA